MQSERGEGREGLRMPRTRIVGAVLACALVACGGSTPEPKAPEPEAPSSSNASNEDHGPKMQVSGGFGSLDPQAVDKTFNALIPKLRTCFKAGQKRVEYLAGDVKFFLHLGTDGAVKYGYLEDSSLGDRETEKCMVDVMKTASWPKPDGGEGEVHSSTGFDANPDVREPTAWSSDKLAETLGKHDADFQKCKEGVQGAFKVTAYVEPDGKFGKVSAVGVTPPNQEGEGKIECLVDALKDLKKIPSPGSYAAKVSFNL